MRSSFLWLSSVASLVYSLEAGGETFADSPIVNLGYATYQGVRLAAGVDEYLGMRYAEAPLGKLRFRAPQDPTTVSGVQSASRVS